MVSHLFAAIPRQRLHPFRVIKRQFSYTKVRFRGLMKSAAQQATLFALSNLWMMRKRLVVVGEVRL